MRLVRFAPQAERTLADQFDYLVSQRARASAHSMLGRVEAFLAHTLAVYPRTGRPIMEHDSDKGRSHEPSVMELRMVIGSTGTSTC